MDAPAFGQTEHSMAFFFGVHPTLPIKEVVGARELISWRIATYQVDKYLYLAQRVVSSNMS